MHNKLNIYIADDHNVVRKGMTRLLKTFGRVGEVQEASNGKELIQMVKKSPPDAVILDIEMPEMGGMSVAHHLVDRFPKVKILVLTMHTEEGLISRLMDMGVHGFLSKSAEPEEVEMALYNIIDHDFYKSNLMKGVLENSKKQPPKPSLETLTNREIEVLTMISKEYSIREIGERLKLSEKTVFNHRANIMAKSGARNNIGLYKYALQHGYSSGVKE